MKNRCHELLEAEIGFIFWIVLQIGMYLVIFACPSWCSCAGKHAWWIALFLSNRVYELSVLCMWWETCFVQNIKTLPYLMASLRKITCRNEAQEAQMSWASGSRNWPHISDILANWHVSCDIGISILMLLRRTACMMDCLIFLEHSEQRINYVHVKGTCFVQNIETITHLIVLLRKGTCRSEAQEAQLSWASGSKSWYLILDSPANWHASCDVGLSIMMLLCRQACTMDYLISFW